MDLITERMAAVAQACEDCGRVCVLIIGNKTSGFNSINNVTKYQRPFVVLINRIFQLSLYFDQLVRLIKGAAV